MSLTLPVGPSTEPNADIFPDTQPAEASLLPPLHPQNVAAVFDALKDMVKPDAPGFGRPLTRGEVFRGHLESHWATAKIVSFDIFDTAIVRKCQSPRDVFLFLADHAPFRGKGSAEHFAQLRQQAENTARTRVHAQTGSGEATLQEIHTELAKLAGFDASLVPQMVAAEEAIELSLCITHPFIHQIYRRAHANGKTVWFVSDSYHNAAFLRRLIAACGYDNPNDRVVSSCDERCSKGSGQLLPKLLKASNVNPAHFVHMGDNMNSDCALPSRQGINGVWHPLAGSPEGAAPSASREHAIASGLAMWGARTFEPARPFWWRFGFSVAGPLLVGFSWWLQEKMREDGVKRAYFMLRDGDVLKRVYDVLTEGDPHTIPSALLESSRRAFMLPALGPSAPSLTSQLFVSENPRPVREFLERLKLRTDDLHAAFLQAGFSSPDQIVGPEHAEKLGRLFSNPTVLQRISARSAEERALLMGYLKQQGAVGSGDRVALVDIGWNATIQKSLDHAAKTAGVSHDAVGYYLGSFSGARRDLLTPSRGYVCEYGLPLERYRPLADFRQLIEFICTSARGSLLHFAKQGDKFVPVVAEPDHNEAQMSAIRELHEGAIDYAMLMREEGQTFGISSLDARSATAPLFRLMERPTDEEARLVGSMQHGDGMGASASRSFAAYSPGPITADKVLTDYGKAYWKAGMLNQQTPHAMMLRTLLWLNDG
jgi:FMN phosphatase YigB (HAD superfamily)